MVDFACSDDSFSRRSLLGNLIHGLTLGRAHVEHLEPMISYYNGDSFGMPGAFLALEVFPIDYWETTSMERPESVDLFPGYGWIGMRRASRAEAIPPEAGPDPDPVSVELMGGVGRLAAVVARCWNDDDVKRCSRCDRCNAHPLASRPGLSGCLVKLENYDGPPIVPTPEPSPAPGPAPSGNLAERKFQRRLAAIKRRNALRKSRERRSTLALALAGSADD